MNRIFVVPAAQTDWSAQGRLLGDTDLPLSEIGHRQAVVDGRALVVEAPTLIRSGTEESARQSASIIAHEMHLRSRAIKELRELDLGLWEGLTVEHVKERFTKAYRQWRNDPFSITPPEGESLTDARKRLRHGVSEIMRRHSGEKLILVLGQFATQIVRCLFAVDGFERFWEMADEDHAIHAIEPVAATSAAGQDGPSGKT